MKPVSGTVLVADTLPEAQRMQIMLWREMSTLDTARVIGTISSRVQELSLAGIRRRHPSASERECRLRYALLTLGRSLALRAYPEAETLHGS